MKYCEYLGIIYSTRSFSEKVKCCELEILECELCEGIAALGNVCFRTWKTNMDEGIER